MAYVIPTDAHMVGDPNHTPDHDNICDVLGLLAAVMAQGAGPNALRSTPPAGNAAAIAALQAVQSWAGKGIGSGYFPWQFPVEAYGAQGNGRIITDATMLTTSNLLNSAAQANFTSADVGKSVLVSCAAGGTYSPLGSTTSAACTITAVNSATQAVLSVSSTSATPGASIAGIATDDSAAINNAIAAAVAYAQANNGYAEVIFSNCIYGLGGTYNPVNYLSGLGNSLIPLPIISPSAQKLLIAFTGPTKTLDQALVHWNQLVPQAASSVLMCLRTDGTNNGTYGPAHVIGSPFDGYGGDLGLFSNIMPSFDGVQIVVPFNTTYGGIDLFGCAEAYVPNSSCMPLAVVNLAGPTGAPYPNMYTSAPANISNQWGWGLRMPCTGNNDRSDVISWSCEGLCYGIGPSEHSYVATTRNIYCIGGVEFYSGNGVSMPHAARVAYASVEGSTFGIGFFDGQVNADVDTIDCETATPIVYDPSNRGVGNIGVRNMGGTPGLTSVASMVNSGLQLKITCLDNAALVGLQTSGAPAAPATTVAQANTYWRDAFVFVTSTTAITVAKVQGNASASLTTISGLLTGAAGTIVIPVPAGKSYSVTSTGTITTQWVLL